MVNRNLFGVQKTGGAKGERAAKRYLHKQRATASRKAAPAGARHLGEGSGGGLAQPPIRPGDMRDLTEENGGGWAPTSFYRLR